MSVPPYTLDATIVGTSTFGSVHFFVVQSGGALSSKSLPRFGSKALIVKRHIPGGDRNVIQQLGRQTDPVQLQILIRLEDRATLVGQVNTINTLTIKYGTAQQALLTAVDAPRDFAEGFALCSVTFEQLG
jgi:hypothetical protein